MMTYILVRKIIWGNIFVQPRVRGKLCCQYVCTYIQYISFFSYMYVTTRVTYNSLKSQRFKFLHTHFPPIFLQSQHQISAALLFHSEYLCMYNTKYFHRCYSDRRCNAFGFFICFIYFLFFGGGIYELYKIHACMYST